MMQRFAARTALALVAVLAVAGLAGAFAIMIPAGPAKVVQADVIVTGKVTSIEAKTIEAAQNAFAKNNVTYKVAVVEVKDMVKGDAKTKTVRVGFIAPMPVQPGGPVPKFPPIGKGNYNIQLTVGQDGLFFLKKHHAADFYILPMFGTFVASENKAAFDNELAITRKTLKALDNPIAGLKAANADERLETAYYLVTMYRTVPFGSPGTNEVPIKAEESQLILKTLLDADWDQTKYQGIKNQQSPANLFNRLNIGPAQGFQPPAGEVFNSPEYANARKNWLAQNWQTFQVKKYVAAPAQPGNPAGPGVPAVQPLPVQPGQPLPPANIPAPLPPAPAQPR